MILSSVHIVKIAEIIPVSIGPIEEIISRSSPDEGWGGIAERITDLNDGDVQEDAPEADDQRGSGHDSRTREEPHAHRESCDRVPARYYPRLQRHEQSCSLTWPLTRRGRRFRPVVSWHEVTRHTELTEYRVVRPRQLYRN